jgi:hypothetical protein
MDANYAMIMMLIIILIVEIPIIALMSYLTYRKRVVKMHPKSSYEIDRTRNYMREVHNYRTGNYEYETIKTEKDVIDAHEKGKIIVFTSIPAGEKAIIWIGLIIMAVMMVIITIIAIVAESDIGFRILMISIGYMIAITIGGVIFIPNIVKLKRLKRSFLILAPEGIIYRRKWGGIRAYSWKELGLNLYRVKSQMKSLLGSIDLPESAQFNVILPNGAALIFKPEEYSHNEFFSLEKLTQNVNQMNEVSKAARYTFISKARRAATALIAVAFEYYHELGKLDMDEKREAYKKIRAEIEDHRAREQPEQKMIHEEKPVLDETKVYHFFKQNQGKAFTIRSIFNKIDELGLDKELEPRINPHMIEEAVDKLVRKGMIVSEQKDLETFYHF